MSTSNKQTQGRLHCETRIRAISSMVEPRISVRMVYWVDWRANEDLLLLEAEDIQPMSISKWFGKVHILSPSFLQKRRRAQRRNNTSWMIGLSR